MTEGRASAATRRGTTGMSSPADPPPAWTAPGGPGDPRPGSQPTPPADGGTASGTGAPPAQPAGWTAPTTPPTGWGTPQAPPTWTGPPPTAPAGPPGYGPGYGFPAAPPVWAPPALQPGIVPLRPLSLGEILDGGVRAVRANPSVMFGLSAVAVTVAVLVSALLSYYLSGVLSGSVSDVTGALSPDLSPAEAGQFTGQVSYAFGSAFTRPITALVTTILTGLLVVAVSRSVLGRTISVREVLRSRRAWWVVGFSLLSGVVVAAAVVLLVGVVIGLAAAHQTGAAVAVGILGALSLLVGAVWFNTRTLLVTPALMLEGKGFWATVKRGWRLTRGSFWRLFGIWLLVSVIMGVLEQIILTPFAIGASVVSSGQLTNVASLAITSVGEIIALTLATTYLSAVVALLYIDVRMRREGLDIELGRAATADAAAAPR
jgi:hypothetical protein